LKLVRLFEGSWNCALAEADWPGAKVAMDGTVRKGDPPKELVAFARVSPDVNESKTIWIGPAVAVALRFVIVKVPSKVWFTRL